ncbi:ABC transporter ATP-binding protein [Serratia marcescens]|nr:ABC transporter ATP-binding protein [Serratia marcescens]
MKIDKGEVVVIIGPSGSGKSTLLRCINKLEEVTSGDLIVDGLKANDPKVDDRLIRQEAGMVFQQFYLFPHLTALENVAFGPIRVRGAKKSDAEKLARELLAKVGLAERAHHYPSELSGGQQQRVAIGRALVYNPPVILLDEPLSNLDAKLREEARVFLRELIIKLGLSALMVTHDQNEAMAISDRILLLNNGKIEQQGTPQEMYGSPTTLFTAEFMGSNNRLPGKIVALEGDRARIEGKDWALWGKAGAGVQVGQEGTAVIRVERVQLGEDPQGNQLELPLLTSMYLGDRWEYLFRTVAEDFVVRAYGHEARDRALCRLSLPAEHLWIFPKA